MDYMEDLEFLRSWACKIKFMLGKMQSITSESGGRCFFTIGNTAKPTENLRPYTTPIRKVSNGIVCGVVVFTQTQGVLAAMLADTLVDSIIVDAEKKIPLCAGVDPAPFEALGLSLPDMNNLEGITSGTDKCNLSSSCSAVIKSADFFEYKSNDMTVEGLWYYLANNMNGLTGKCIAVIGGGNIGFKLAIKLVESGSNVHFVRRDRVKGQALVDAANLIKPAATTASVSYNDNVVQASTSCDAVIGCTNGKAVIDTMVVNAMNPQGLLVDVGKGSVTAEAVILAAEKGINVLRFDVTSAIDGMIATIESNRAVSAKIGRKVIAEGIAVVSGGYLGAEGDIVVDDYRKPEQIFGVCDGHGDFKQQISPRDELNLNRLSNDCEIDKNIC